MNNLNTNQLNIDQINTDQINIDQINTDQINTDQINIDQINTDQINIDQINTDQMKNLNIIEHDNSVNYLQCDRSILGDCDGPLCIFCWTECTNYIKTHEERTRQEYFNSDYCSGCKIYFKCLFIKDSTYIPYFLVLKIGDKEYFNPIIENIDDILNTGVKFTYMWKKIDTNRKSTKYTLN